MFSFSIAAMLKVYYVALPVAVFRFKPPVQEIVRIYKVLYLFEK